MTRTLVIALVIAAAVCLTVSELLYRRSRRQRRAFAYLRYLDRLRVCIEDTQAKFGIPLIPPLQHLAEDINRMQRDA